MIREIEIKNQQQWLELRKKSIGGSDAAAVVNLNQYQSRYSLWAEKTGKVEAFAGNIATDVGHILEDYVAQLFEMETGKKVEKRDVTIYNDEYPFAHANVDRFLVDEDAILECKTTSSIPFMRIMKNGKEFPDSWYCQMVHYLAVTGKKKAYLSVLIGNSDHKIFELERDEAEIAALMQAEKEFWAFVETNTEPPADGFKATSETLAAMYPCDDGNNVDLMAFENDMAEYLRISAQIKVLETQKDEAANKVKAFMGNSSAGESANYKVSWKTSERRTFDNKKFAKDNPALDLDGYYTITTSRTFRCAQKKGEK